MVYINVCDRDWLDVLLLASWEKVEWMVTILKTAGGMEEGNGRL